MTTKQGTIYVADDGSHFFSKEQCVAYELDLLIGTTYSFSIGRLLAIDNRSKLPALIAKLQELTKE